MRRRIEILNIDCKLSVNEYQFMLASLLVSADSISNVPAVYGCYLKKYKAKALKSLYLIPIHENNNPSSGESYNADVLDDKFLSSFTSDMVYLDPPYNSRQYSKNYFPLNIIAKTPTELENEPDLKGKTGIPTDCFLSPFCRKGDGIREAFDKLRDAANVLLEIANHIIGRTQT